MRFTINTYGLFYEQGASAANIDKPRSIKNFLTLMQLYLSVINPHISIQSVDDPILPYVQCFIPEYGRDYTEEQFAFNLMGYLKSHRHKEWTVFLPELCAMTNNVEY